jgi:hypothetical protein
MFMRNIHNSTLPLQLELLKYINDSFNNVHQSSPANINQQNCGGFGTNSIINSSFINTLNAHFQNTQGKSFFLDWNSHQIPMTQPLPMSSSRIGVTRRIIINSGSVT